jgi:hypothetical protein
MAQPLVVDEYEDPIIELDDQQRADLSLVADHRIYRVHREPNGTIVLHPEPSDEELEARYLANQELVTRIERAMANPESMRPRPERKR